MNIEKIQNRLLTSKLLLFTIVFAFIAVRLFAAGSQWDNLSLWGSMLIQIGIAFFLLQLNLTFNIIKERTFLPALFYLLLIGSNPIFFFDIKGSIAALCVALSYYCLFASYQKPESQINALNISLLLVLGSLLWTPLLFFFPVFWRGFHRLQCLNTRVLFANLTGFAVVYLFIFALSIAMNDRNIFLTFLPHIDILLFFQKPDLTIFELLTAGFILPVYLAIGFYLFFLDISESVWTITALSFFYFSLYVIIFFFLLLPEYKSSWGLISFIPVAFLCGHFFSRLNKRIVQFSLLAFFLFLVVTGIISLI